MKRVKVLPFLFLLSLVVPACNKPSGPALTGVNYLIGSFVGNDGELVVTKDKVTLGNQVFKVNRTTKEEISYVYDKVNYKEKVYVMYLDNDYRVTVTNSLIKRIVLEKKVSNGSSYQEVCNFVPEANYFAGAYNGIGKYDYSDYNNVLSIAGELTFGEKFPGYGVSSYNQGTYQDLQQLVVPGFYTADEDNPVVVADFLDLADGQFFEFVLTMSENGDMDQYLEGDIVSCFYADASIFLTEVIDDEGNKLNNSYEVVYDEETFESSLEVTIDGSKATSVTQNFSQEKGVYFTASLENNSEITFSCAKDNFVYRYTNSNDAKDHYYASTSTMYELTYYNEQKVVSGDFSKVFSYDLDMDYDTWEDLPIYKYNNVVITNDIKIASGKHGRVSYSFTFDNKEIEIEKINSAISYITVDGVKEYGFDYGYVDKAFTHTFYNPAVPLKVEINDFKVAINDGEAVQATITYQESFNRITLLRGNVMIVPISSEDGLFAYYSGNDLVPLTYKSNIDSLYGEYTCNGTDKIKFTETNEFLINNVKVEYEMDFISNGTDLVIGFITKDNNFIIPNFAGVLNYYYDNQTKSASYVSLDIYSSFIGVYAHIFDKNESGIVYDYIRFGSDGSLTLDSSDGQGGIIRDVPYNYVFQSEGDIYKLTVLYPMGGGYIGVPFNKTDFALVFGAGSDNTLFYVDERIFMLNGVYGDGTSNTLFITENVIYINDQLQTITSVAKENNVTTITTSTHIITAVEENGNYTVSSYKKSEGEANKVTYTVKDSELFFYQGVSFPCAQDNYSYSVKATYSTVTNKISLTVYQNTGYFANKVYPVYDNGKLVLRVSSFFGNYNLYFDNGTPVAVKL